jgi:phospholipase C
MNQQRKKWMAVCALMAMFGGQLSTVRVTAHEQKDDQGRDESHEHEGPRTATPIKHVIVLIGENRTFDNVYATYVPKQGQQISNLLSKGIIKADGTPGPNHALATQFTLANISPLSFFVSTDKLNAPGKTAYTPFLPTPEAGSAPPRAVTLAQFVKDPAPTAPPFDANTFSLAQLHTISPVIVPGDLHLLTSGFTGLTNCTVDPTEPPSPCQEPDTRVAHFNALPNTSFQITGPHVPYDSYSGDMVHRFYHMWQQSDCSVAHATPDIPSGCLNDLYPFVGIARGDDSGSNCS